MLTYAIIGLIIGVVAATVYIISGDYEPKNTLYNVLEVISRLLMSVLIVAASVCLWAPILVVCAVIALLAFVAG